MRENIRILSIVSKIIRIANKLRVTEWCPVMYFCDALASTNFFDQHPLKRAVITNHLRQNIVSYVMFNNTLLILYIKCSDVVLFTLLKTLECMLN